LGDSLRHFRYLNLSDQLDNAIIALAKKAEGLFSGYYINATGLENIDKLIVRLIGFEISDTQGQPYNSGYPYIIAYSPEGSALIKQLYENGYITKNQENPTSVVQLGLTLKGWQRYNELQRGSLVTNTAFMAMEFAYSNWAYTNLFRPAVEVCGFKLETVEEKPNHGSIPDDIELKIKRAPFVIVDISHGSNGAYWEGGFATALKIPVIYTCDEATWKLRETHPENVDFKPLLPHFDIDHRRIVLWKKDDPEAETNKNAPEKIKAIIRNNIYGATMDDGRLAIPFGSEANDRQGR